jgi:hypothetical protein
MAVNSLEVGSGPAIGRTFTVHTACWYVLWLGVMCVWIITPYAFLRLLVELFNDPDLGVEMGRLLWMLNRLAVAKFFLTFLEVYILYWPIRKKTQTFLEVYILYWPTRKKTRNMNLSRDRRHSCWESNRVCPDVYKSKALAA